jgi:AcrR family transcriptional regulator
MRVPRQGNSAKNAGEALETGRVNQKQRTRSAIVDAARRLMDDGTTPTVAQAAELALVSRTTAYRYFPTQESLLLEVALHADVGDIEALVREPIAPGGAAEHALHVLRVFNEHVLDEEVRFRTAMRVYQDMWLGAAASGEESPLVREGRRQRWFADALAPLREELGDEAWTRLVAALSVFGGMEAMTVLRDVCRLDRKEALAVADWAARALVAAAQSEGD